MPTSGRRLHASEDGVPLLDEGLRRLTVVLGQPAARVVPRLEVEQVLERPTLRRVEVALHVAVGDPWAPREPRGERHRLPLEVRIGDDPVDDPELPRLAGVHNIRGVVELARLRGADELGEEPATAEVARVRSESTRLNSSHSSI